MMVPKSLILAGAALALFGASASAQSQSGKVFARYNKPLKSATLDLATGTITRGPVVNNRAATTVVDFNNNDLGGFVGVDTGGGFCEWFDAGVKGLGNNSDLMNDVVFAYCSAMLAPGSGGPGGSVKLGFYEGYTTFGGAPTTGVAKFTLTGLPGNSASSSFFGGFNCFFIRVFFGTLVNFCDGPIGYSWKFLDTGLDGTLAGTWPFLSCVASCSGAILQVDGSGMTDAIDEYCPPGTLRATFTFGTTSGSFTSMSMDVREVADISATAATFNACTTPNGDLLDTALSTRWADCTKTGAQVATTDLDGGAVVGGTWVARVEGHSSFGGPLRNLNAASLTVGTTAIHAPCNGINPPTGVTGRKLYAGFLLGPVAMTAIDATHRSYTQVIPKTLALVCVPFAAQAICVGPGGARLSSAVEGTSGTN